MRAAVGTPRDTRGSGAARGNGARRQRALRHRVHLAVGRKKRRHEQRAAGEIGGVAEGRNCDIDAAAAAGEGREVGGDHHRGDVLRVELENLVPGVHAQPFQHPDQRFTREHRFVQLVAGVVQPDDKAVADELVFADTLDTGDILDADLRRRGQGGDEQNKQDERAENLGQGGPRR
jgi:hypothetical protein